MFADLLFGTKGLETRKSEFEVATAEEDRSILSTRESCGSISARNWDNVDPSRKKSILQGSTPRFHLASVFLGVLTGNGDRGKANRSNFDKEIDEIDFTT